MESRITVSTCICTHAFDSSVLLIVKLPWLLFQYYSTFLCIIHNAVESRKQKDGLNFDLTLAGISSFLKDEKFSAADADTLGVHLKIQGPHAHKDSGE